MDDQALEQHIRTAAEHAAPDVLDRVLSSCGKQKGRVIPMTNQTGKRQPRALRGLIAACLLLVLAGGGGFYYWQANAVTSIVSLDVNPSIELRVNSQEKVLACNPLNADAAQVLFEMDGGGDLEGAKLDVAVNAIVGALVRHGYLDSISSALLISVEDNDQARADRLQQELTDNVTALLQEQAAAAAIYSQSLTQDAGLEQMAQANSISTGKAALVNQVLSMNNALTFEQLAALSVEELNQLIKTGAPGMPIGCGQARATAEQYAGLTALDSVTADVDPELDETPPHYDVELHTHFGEFEYKVDAYTGVILSGQANIMDQSGTPAVPSQSPAPSQTPAPSPSSAPSGNGRTLISEADAKSYALAHANCSASDAVNLTCHLEYDDGLPECYEVEFTAGGFEYEYEIHCYTGAVIKYECDSSGGHHGGAATAALIGEDSAKTYAFTHASCSASDVINLTCHLEYDDGLPEHYDIEFCAGDYCYEYEIDCHTGTVLDHKCESYISSGHHHGGTHHSEPSHNGGTAASVIGDAAAKTAAFTHAGVSAADVYDLEIELDTDDGLTFYEMEFKAGGMEYEYEIDAYTGTVLKAESDWD